MGDLTSEQKIARLRSAVVRHEVMDRRDALATLAALDAARAEVAREREDRNAAERDRDDGWALATREHHAHTMTTAYLVAARDDPERLTTERDDARRAHVCAVADAQRRREKARTAMLDAWRDAEACEAEIERLRTAAADELADVVAWLRGMGRGFASHLASEIERGAHVGAAKGGERG